MRTHKTLAVLLFVAAAASLGATPAPATKGLQYVALGDSYSSGLGLGHDVAGSPDFCHRSQQNFPHLLAQALDLRLTDATCASATTANVTTSALKFGKGSAPVQIGALSKKTDVVTISIGGNDLGFVDATRSCVALGPTGPLLLSKNKNCQSLYVRGGSDALLQRLSTTVAPALDRTFATIRRDAPHAKVFVVGYPTIFPAPEHTPTGGCFNAKLSGDSLQSIHAVNILPFTDVDVAYLHTIEQALDDTTRSAASSAGFTYVSTLDATALHSACAPSGERYINGVSIDRTRDGGVSLAAGSLHPDAAGAAFLATAVQGPVAEAFKPVVGSPAPTVAAPASVPWLLFVAPVVVVIAAVIMVGLLRRRRAR